MLQEMLVTDEAPSPNVLVRGGKLIAYVSLIGGLAAAGVMYGARRAADLIDFEQLPRPPAATANKQLFHPDEIDMQLESSMCDPSKCKPTEVDVIDRARIDRLRPESAHSLSVELSAENIIDPILIRIDGAYFLVGHNGLAGDRGIVKWRWDPAVHRICATDREHNPVIKKVRLGRDVNSGGFSADVATFRYRNLPDDVCYQALTPEEIFTGKAPLVRASSTTSSTAPPVQQTSTRRRLSTENTGLSNQGVIPSTTELPIRRSTTTMPVQPVEHDSTNTSNIPRPHRR